MRRAILAFLPSVIGAYLLGSLFATQVILARIEAMGFSVALRDRLHATAHDIVGLSTSYLPLVALAFLLALPVAVGLSSWLPRLRLYLYGLAGAVAITAIHVAMKQVLGLNGIAAVRDPHGLALQAVAGWFGGYLFYVFTGRAHRRAPSPFASPRA